MRNISFADIQYTSKVYHGHLAAGICRHALSWGTVKMVSAAWVFESLAAGLRLDEDVYPVPQKGSQQPSTNPAATKQGNSIPPRYSSCPYIFVFSWLTHDYQ
jgi:hypothetical protein